LRIGSAILASCGLSAVPVEGQPVRDAARASATAPRHTSFSAEVQRSITVNAPVIAIVDVVLVDGTGAPAREG
jgi:hypothetical protein